MTRKSPGCRDENRQSGRSSVTCRRGTALLRPEWVFRLSASDLETLSAAGMRSQPDLRASVVREAADIASDNVFLEFSRFFLLVSHDGDPAVRQLAVQALGNPLGEDVEPRLIEVLEHDPVEDVRVAAATSLGPWAELAEMGESGRRPARRDRGSSCSALPNGSPSPGICGGEPPNRSRFSDRDARSIGSSSQMYDEDEIGLRASAIYAPAGPTNGNGCRLCWKNSPMRIPNSGSRPPAPPASLAMSTPCRRCPNWRRTTTTPMCGTRRSWRSGKSVVAARSGS